MKILSFPQKPSKSAEDEVIETKFIGVRRYLVHPASATVMGADETEEFLKKKEQIEFEAKQKL